MRFTFISVAVIKCPKEDSFRKEGLILVHSSRFQSITGGKSQAGAWNTLQPVKSRQKWAHWCTLGTQAGLYSYRVQGPEPRTHSQAGSSPSIKATERDLIQIILPKSSHTLESRQTWFGKWSCYMRHGINNSIFKVYQTLLEKGTSSPNTLAFSYARSCLCLHALEKGRQDG